MSYVSNESPKRPSNPVWWLVRWLMIVGLAIFMSNCMPDEKKCPKGSTLVRADESQDDWFFYDVCIVALSGSSTTDDTADEDAGVASDE